ncbi:MAG: tetratricopeptide repeat protein [Candidatus Omnitrophica bacterium]|nr:tetratricopeptide repeat protein [Candidatus Omnitrophota bacterium]
MALKQKMGLVIASSIIAILLLEIGLRLGGLILSSIEEARNRSSITGKQIYTIVCLGESTTMFGGINSYPRHLERILNEKNEGIQFKVINKGVPSYDTAYILSKLAKIIADYQPDIVISMMGINDSIHTPVYKDNLRIRTMLFLQEIRIVKLVKLLRSHILRKIADLSGNRKFPGAEDLIAEIELNPKTQYYYQMLGEYYESLGHGAAEEKLFRKAIAKRPDKSWAYGLLGKFLARQGRNDEATEVYKGAIKKYPRKTWGYVLLGHHYEDMGEMDKAEELYKTAVSIINSPYEILHDLGYHYEKRGDFKKAMDVFNQLIESNRAGVGIYVHLGTLYLGRGEIEKAAAAFKRAFSVDPTRTDGIIDRLTAEGKYGLVEDLLKSVVETHSEKDLLYRQLGALYQRWGKEELAQEFFLKADSSADSAYHDATKTNYRNLAKALKKKGIKLICVQYPMRSVLPLQKIFDSAEDITFVENKQNFEQAVKEGTYEDYFADKFAGDFGHCTQKGNKLLAENVAKSIFRLSWTFKRYE